MHCPLCIAFRHPQVVLKQLLAEQRLWDLATQELRELACQTLEAGPFWATERVSLRGRCFCSIVDAAYQCHVEETTLKAGDQKRSSPSRWIPPHFVVAFFSTGAWKIRRWRLLEMWWMASMRWSSLKILMRRDGTEKFRGEKQTRFEWSLPWGGSSH